MLLAEHDLELLEGHLDGALSVEESAALERRLDGAAHLAGVLDALRAHRAERRAVWGALEPTEQEVERCVAAVMAGIRNTHASPPRQKEAVLPEDLIAMLETEIANAAANLDRRFWAAWALLTEWTTSESLRKHALAVETA